MGAVRVAGNITILQYIYILDNGTCGTSGYSVCVVLCCVCGVHCAYVCSISCPDVEAGRKRVWWISIVIFFAHVQQDLQFLGIVD